MNYYNDNDRFNADWLEQLAWAGMIPAGEIDERSIKEVQAHEVRHHGHVHLFAGIGGWALALELAGWPTDRPVWTGSCPCQPFSGAGDRKGTRDERHLWPEMFRLVKECKPATIFGEQVAGPDGQEWLAGVFDDLEGIGYACASAVLPAACVGAPHQRHRIFFVADRGLPNPPYDGCGLKPKQRQMGEGADRHHQGTAAAVSGRDGVGHCNGAGLEGWQLPVVPQFPSEVLVGETMPHGGVDIRMGHVEDLWAGGEQQQAQVQPPEQAGGSGAQMGAWHSPGILWVLCDDGFARRVEPGVWPVADGIPHRVGKIRGFGNAIVPQTAAVFVRAFMEASCD